MIDVLTVAYYYFVSFLIFPTSFISPPSEAVDDRFQHILDVLIDMTMGQLNAQAQELSIDMLDVRAGDGRKGS